MRYDASFDHESTVDPAISFKQSWKFVHVRIRSKTSCRDESWTLQAFIDN